MLTSFKRVLHLAFVDFYRNKGISIAAIFVLLVTTLLVTGLFFIHGVSGFIISNVKNKIDITAYFKADTQEQDILVIKDDIVKSSPDVKSVEYVSKEDALKNFNEKHQNNEVFSRALTEVGGNPFLPSLNIITSGDPAQYAKVASILQSDQYNKFVEKVDFSQKKDTIEKVFSITSNITKFGLGIGAILFLVVILVVFNTIKLIIEASKEEISTMRIVGASSWFVRAPFVIQGVVFGIISFVICFLITIFAAYGLSSGMALVIPGFNMFNYFLSNLWLVILIQLGFGVGLGVISSYIAIRSYLKV